MATELAKGYVQIVPSARGIKGSITDAIGGEAASAGESAGRTIGTKIKGAIIAAGIGMAIKEAVQLGAELEQSIGGVQTLFGDSADDVVRNAQKAFETAGMSANDYMENVTSFSASLLQSLGGDTDEAAKVADMALVDMSDNANKMGTSMDSITMAYQGFARGQYQLLDNLKLGYGGTKTEMERLLADAEELTGVEYDINNLADVYEAIHAIQEEIGITGTTSEEASETFTGSFAAMKASAENLLADLTIGDKVEGYEPDLEADIQSLIDTATTFLEDNAVPMLMTFLNALIENLPAIIEGLVTAIAGYLPELIVNICTMAGNLIKNIPSMLGAVFEGLVGVSFSEIWGMVKEEISTMIQNAKQKVNDWIDTGNEWINGLSDGIYEKFSGLWDNAKQWATDLKNKVKEKLSSLKEKGKEWIGTLRSGVQERFTTLKTNASTWASETKERIKSKLTSLNSKGQEFIGTLRSGIQSKFTGLFGSVSSWASTVKQNIKNGLSSLYSIGSEWLTGLWNGINDKVGWLCEKIRGIGSSAVQAIKDFFKIGSPSKLMREEVGVWIIPGLVDGIDSQMSLLDTAMSNIGRTTTARINGAISTDVNTQGMTDVIGLLNRIADKDTNVTVKYNGREVARSLKGVMA